MKKILVISPHPDDETLGAGGYLLKLADENNELYWLNIANADEKYGYSSDEVLCGKNEIQNVAAAYGMKEVVDLKLEPTGLDKYNTSELVNMFGPIIKKIEPNIIILPYKNDIHSDHRIVFDVAFSCTKAFRYPSIEKVLSMEIISETDYAVSDIGFVPNFFVDITNYVEEKIKIMKEYKNEIKSSPFPRNEDAIRSLAQFRGAGCNVKYAEAFRIIKEIVR